MPVGPQYSIVLGKMSMSMNGLQVLARPERAELAVGVAQPEGRLPGVVAGAHELELERRLQLAHRGRRRRPHAEARLPHPGEVAVVLAELVLVGRQLRGAQRVEPVGVDLLEVVADVQHGEAVDLHAGLRLWPPPAGSR